MRDSEPQAVLFEVKLISYNPPVTYVSPNTIETCLTPKHLLFGRQLPYKHTTCIPRVYSNAADKIKGISNHFWDRCRHEYVVNLCET